MLPLGRLANNGRLAALATTLYPTLEDVLTEAFASAFSEQVPSLPGPGWLALLLSLLAGVVLGKLPALVDRCARSMVSKRRARAG